MPKDQKMNSKTKMVLTENECGKAKEGGAIHDLEVHINLTSLHLQKFAAFMDFLFSLPLLNHKQLHNIRIIRGMYIT